MSETHLDAVLRGLVLVGLGLALVVYRFPDAHRHVTHDGIGPWSWSTLACASNVVTLVLYAVGRYIAPMFQFILYAVSVCVAIAFGVIAYHQGPQLHQTLFRHATDWIQTYFTSQQ